VSGGRLWTGRPLAGRPGRSNSQDLASESIALLRPDRPVTAFMAARQGLQPVAALFGWAVLVAITMSTQFLFQPFVWRNWELADIIPAWLDIARDRAVVALAIVASLAAVGGLRLPGRLQRLATQILAIVIGAGLGEGILAWLGSADDRMDALSILGRVVCWSLVGGAITVMRHLWRSGAALAAVEEEARIDEAHLRRLAASTRLESLRRQIEPHFLFNTLATIRSLRQSDPDQGQHLLGRLFDYMSATLGGEAARPSTLADEIELVRAYLDVCASRMSGRLVVTCDVPKALLALPFPPLILATLAENAMKHGVFPRNQGVITITAATVGDMVEVAIADDGVGLSGEGGAGLGLANIAERLRLLHGPDAGLHLRANSPRGVRASVRIPAGADLA